MEFYDLIEKRHSVRAYKNTPIDQEIIDRILYAAQIAPTAANRQAFKIIVISTKDRQETLRKIYDKHWFTEPPYVLLVCAIQNKAWVRKDGKNYADVDSAIIMDHIILAATDEGLGTCWIGNFDPEAARVLLGLPDDMEPIAFTTLGYEREKMRKEIDELVSRF